MTELFALSKRRGEGRIKDCLEALFQGIKTKVVV